MSRACSQSTHEYTFFVVVKFEFSDSDCEDDSFAGKTPSGIVRRYQDCGGACRSSSGQSLASHTGGPGARPGRACGVCGGKCGTGADFLQVLRFPLPIFISPISLP
jgi:hypothetical protein